MAQGAVPAQPTGGGDEDDEEDDSDDDDSDEEDDDEEEEEEEEEVVERAKAPTPPPPMPEVKKVLPWPLCCDAFPVTRCQSIFAGSRQPANPFRQMHAACSTCAPHKLWVQLQGDMMAASLMRPHVWVLCVLNTLLATCIAVMYRHPAYAV